MRLARGSASSASPDSRRDASRSGVERFGADVGLERVRGVGKGLQLEDHEDPSATAAIGRGSSSRASGGGGLAGTKPCAYSTGCSRRVGDIRFEKPFHLPCPRTPSQHGDRVSEWLARRYPRNWVYAPPEAGISDVGCRRRSVLERRQAFADRLLRQIRHAVDAELAHDVAPVRLDRAGGDEEALADLRRRQALRPGAAAPPALSPEGSVRAASTALPRPWSEASTTACVTSGQR